MWTTPRTENCCTSQKKKTRYRTFMLKKFLLLCIILTFSSTDQIQIRAPCIMNLNRHAPFTFIAETERREEKERERERADVFSHLRSGNLFSEGV